MRLGSINISESCLSVYIYQYLHLGSYGKIPAPQFGVRVKFLRVVFIADSVKTPWI